MKVEQRNEEIMRKTVNSELKCNNKLKKCESRIDGSLIKLDNIEIIENYFNFSINYLMLLLFSRNHIGLIQLDIIKFYFFFFLDGC